MAANTFNLSELAIRIFQQFYRMQSDPPKDSLLHKICAPRKQKFRTITERERKFEASPISSGMAYNALEDKYAFGYFQNQSVQRHLKKLLKNAKQLPPSTDTRKIITSLSQKILRPEEKRTLSVREQVKGRTVTEGREDIYYPYKLDLKLKSLEKIKQNIEKKERSLQLAQEKVVYFPRLKTTGENFSHEKAMQNLIERQDRLLASKQILAGKFKHAEFMNYLSRVKQASSPTKQSNAG